MCEGSEATNKKKNVHLALFDILDSLIHIIGKLLPDADTQFPLQVLRNLNFVGENMSQCLYLFLDLK
jgi:hypothetical protein